MEGEGRRREHQNILKCVEDGGVGFSHGMKAHESLKTITHTLCDPHWEIQTVLDLSGCLHIKGCDRCMLGIVTENLMMRRR